MSSDESVRVLFVCTENAVRSQMAEGLLRVRGGPSYDVYSAGTDPSGVHPLAVRVMDEIGVDLRGHVSERIGAYRAEPMDYVVTLCGETRDLTPSLRAREMVIHQPFDDPAAAGDPLSAFRRVRDALADWIDRAFALQAA